MVDAGAAGWNGYRYWMAFTPYPGSNDDYENPSIVASADKETWVVPEGLTNPVVAFPGGESFNADPDLVLVDGTMYLFYIEVIDGDDVEVYYKTSADGVTWSAATHIDLGGAFPTKFKSPAFVHMADDTWVMYYADSRLYRTTATTLAGPWSNPVQVLNNIGVLSHVDVIGDGTTHYAILMNTTYTLQFAASFNNGITWWVKADDILSWSAEGGWDDWGFYRSTIQRTATGFDLWYTGKASVDDWRFGYTTITL